MAGLTAAGVLSVGIAVPAVALAQDDSEPSATPSATATTPAEDGPAGDEDYRTERMTELAEALAAELGVSADDVSAAMEKVRGELGHPAGGPGRGFRFGDRSEGTADRQARVQESLDAAVTDGELTQEEADAVLKAYEAGVLPGPGRAGKGMTDESDD